MPFAGNEDDIALLRHHGCRADGLLAINNRHHLLHLLRSEARQHVVDDVLRLFKTRIITGDDDAVALLHGLLRHERAFALVAIAAGTADRDDLSLSLQHLVNGTQHVLQRIGRMGIVHNGRKSLWRADGLQSSGHAVQRTHHHQHILGLLAKHNGSAIDSQQIADVELANELHAYLAAVDFQVHALEVALYQPRTEIGHRTGGIGLHRRFCVLHHEHSVLIVGIGDGEAAFGQHVEELLLGVAIVLHRLVVVQMVTRQVGEDTAGKLQSTDALLGDGVA